MAWLYQTDVVIVKSFERTGLFLGVGAEAAQHPTSPPPSATPLPPEKIKRKTFLNYYPGILGLLKFIW